MAEKNNLIHILLADDDEDDCLLFQDALDDISQSDRLTVARDGIHAMTILYELLPELPDIVFLDLNMPLKNGFECLSEIKTDNRLAHLPVVIFSTSAQQSAIDRTYDSGAWLYLKKPDKFSNLKKVLESILNARRHQKSAQPPKHDFLLNE